MGRSTMAQRAANTLTHARQTTAAATASASARMRAKESLRVAIARLLRSTRAKGCKVAAPHMEVLPGGSLCTGPSSDFNHGKDLPSGFSLDAAVVGYRKCKSGYNVATCKAHCMQIAACGTISINAAGCCFVYESTSCPESSHASKSQYSAYKKIGQLKVQVQKPATGACPSGYALTEAECAGLDGQIIDGKSVKYIHGATYGNPEQCGCYFDSGNKVYFNRRTTDCTQADAGEIGICKHAYKFVPGKKVTVKSPNWTPLSTCPAGYKVVGIARIDIQGNGNNKNHVNDLEVSDKGARAFIYSGNCDVTARCATLPSGASIKNGAMLKNQKAKQWTPIAKCPSGYKAIGLARLDIVGGNNDQNNINDFECNDQGCKAWCWTSGSCSVQPRCVEGVRVVTGTYVTGNPNGWGPHSKCPSGTTAAGIARLDLKTGSNNVHVNDFQCNDNGCRVFCYGSKCQISARCIGF